MARLRIEGIDRVRDRSHARQRIDELSSPRLSAWAMMKTGTTAIPSPAIAASRMASPLFTTIRLRTRVERTSPAGVRSSNCQMWFEGTLA